MVYSPDWEIDTNPSDANDGSATVGCGNEDLKTIGDYDEEEKDD